ncbi:MAG: 7TM diverse intracellular signaling domain-containing protein [Vicingaceae bacterium]
MHKKIILIGLLLFAVCLQGQTETFVEYNGNKQKLDITTGLYLYEDPSGQESIEDVLKSSNFRLLEPGVPNLGVSSNAHWIYFDLKNSSSLNDLQLVLAQPSIQDLKFFTPTASGFKMLDLGSSLNYSQRPYDYQLFVIPLNLKTGEQQRFYMRIKSFNPVVLPLSVGTEQSVYSGFITRDLFFGLYAGAILVMFFYNLFIYFSVKDNSYLIYVIYILVVGLIQASLGGYTFRFLLPDNPWLANQSLVLLPALGGMLAIEFLKVFTHTKDLIPKMNRFFLLGHGLFLLCIGISLAGNNILSSQLIQPSALIASLYMIACTVVMIRKGSRPAIFFMTAWVLFLIGIVVYVLKESGIFPYNPLTNHILEVGSAIEVILLAIGLADRINILRKEKEESQAQALEALMENERIVREQNVLLETKVEERTKALQKANDDLNLALVNLKEAQSQLVSAEKMASLGQLTAGIAHEINNPINFVKSNIEPLNENISEILTLIDKYQAMARDKKEELGQALDEIEKYKKDIDYEYLIEETDEILSGIKEGADRTAEIVLGLRTFSHVDDIGLKSVDVNQGLISTIQLLKGEITNDIDLELELGETKDLECYGGKINQVFMNVINNSVQAVKAKNGAGGKITVRTEDLSEGVKISIIDEGIGMDEETKEKMFEPFFTTKDVGEGTGLGLSVVYGIIESHHGNVQINSEPGKGTSFIINLPYKQPN